MTDYTIATATGTVIAEVRHVDINDPAPKFETINLTDSDLMMAVLGSGALTYSWWLSITTNWDMMSDWTDANSCHVTCEAPDEGQPNPTCRITPALLRETIALIHADGGMEYTESVRYLDWADNDVDSDVDADIADTILQVAVLGRVVYG